MSIPNRAIVLVLVIAACRDAQPPPHVQARTSPAARRTATVADPLPSWNGSPTKTAIVQFVSNVTRAGGPFFIPPAERIAVFDNDGTLWVEQPMYTQLAFALDRVRQLAPTHPEWNTQQPFAGILAGDPKAITASGEAGIAELIAQTHANTTTDEFERIVTDWIATAQHPTLHRRYTELAYLPMLELLAYLRANGFATYIVSGGGVEFMRPWSEVVYGVPRNQVVGSRAKMKFEDHNGQPVLARLPAIDLVDDGPGKPVGIQQTIGRRPILAVGNSDGDFEMLDWVTSAPGPRLGLIVHHTDATREFAYDRDSHVGRLSRALDAAPTRHWLVVDMKQDWKRVFR